MNSIGDAPSGVIISVQMINFMKHDNLVIPFTPNVNFITGRNGSGKSSILVALTVGLGGTTRTVGRGSNLSDLIKDGRHEATIIIQLRNTPGGYEELIYGPVITITRKIRQNSSSFEINNLSKKDKIREELSRILQFFSIQVDNPCTIMSQDTSREFIGVSTPQRKYELFMKGTLLSRLEEEICKIKGNIENVEKQREDRKSEMADINYQLDEKKRLYDIVMEYDDISQRIHSLEDEIVWSQYMDEKKELDKLYKYLEENKDNLKLQIQNVEKNQDEYQLINIKYSKLDERRRARHLEIANIKKKIEDMEKLKNQNSMILTDKKGKLKLRKNKIENIKKDIEMKTLDLRKLIQRRKNADEELHDKRFRFIAEQEDQRDLLHKKLSDIDDELEQLKVDINQASNDFESCQNSLKICQSDYENIKKKRDFLMSLSSNSREEISIRSLIDKNINKFSYRPIGPIGHFIHMKDKKWGIAAQNVFGRLLKSFIVNSRQDEMTLRNIAKEKLNIITTNFNLPTNLNIRPLNYNQCINALDSIEISSVEIRGIDGNIVNSKNIITNVFLDILNADKIWIFENHQDARNASFSYHITTVTLSGATFKVQCGYEMRAGAKFTECKIGLSDQMRIQQMDSEIRQLRDKIDQKRYLFDNIKRNQHNLRARKSNLNDQREEIIKKLNEIDFLIKNPPEDGFDYDAQIKNIEERIEKLKKDLEEYEQSITILEEEIRPLKEEKAKFKSDLQDLSNELKQYDPIGEEIDNVQEQRNSIKKKLEIEEKKRKQLEGKIIDIEAKVTEKKRKVQDDYQKALTMFPQGELKYKNNSRPTSTLVALLKTEINNYNEIQNSKNIDFSAIQKDYQELKKQFEEASKYLRELDEFIYTAKFALEKRETKIAQMRSSYTRRAKVSFLQYQSKRRFDGKLHFNHIDKEISIKIKNRSDTSYTDVSELSGGEKSFALVSLLLSLWSLMDTPFFAIDEFDVFMDDINRQAAMVLLIDGAKKMENKQFIFITPLSLDTLKTDDLVSVFELN